MDGRAWQAAVHGVAKSQTLKRYIWEIEATKLPPTEKSMAPYSGTLAWKIPRMEDPGRLQSMGSLRVGHD